MVKLIKEGEGCEAWRCEEGIAGSTAAADG